MHRFGHISIPTTNFKKSKKFFGQIFGWEFEDLPKLDYVLFKTAEHPNGSFYRVKKMPKKGQVNVYIEVEDVEATLKSIKKAKGKVVLKKTKLGEMGWMGQFSTPDGCYLSLWQPIPPEPQAVEEVTPQKD